MDRVSVKGNLPRVCRTHVQYSIFHKDESTCTYIFLCKNLNHINNQCLHLSYTVPEWLKCLYKLFENSNKMNFQLYHNFSNRKLHWNNSTIWVDIASHMKYFRGQIVFTQMNKHEQNCSSLLLDWSIFLQTLMVKQTFSHKICCRQSLKKIV